MLFPLKKWPTWIVGWLVGNAFKRPSFNYDDPDNAQDVWALKKKVRLSESDRCRNFLPDPLPNYHL